MKLDIGGEQRLSASAQQLWDALNDPLVLSRCIPGCREVILEGDGHYRVVLSLKVASVGGSFEGAITLSERIEPETCRITVSGGGTLGQGTGTATFALTSDADETTVLRYVGEGEIGGLVAGVGHRVLKGVSRHLIGRFFAKLKDEVSVTVES